MYNGEHVALIGAILAAAVLTTVAVRPLAERLRLPAPALVLVGAAVTARFVPAVHAPPRAVVQHVVTGALVVVLFDGGRQLGWRRFRAVAGSILVLGILGTALTAAATAAFLHLVFGLGWYLALLVGTAVAPTDPAVVFSVLGGGLIRQPAGALLAGESGANDPVGIALMVSLLAAGHLGGAAAGQVAEHFAWQLAVGTGLGLALGGAMRALARRRREPGAGLPLGVVLAGMGAAYGLAAAAGGSGYLAVFLAGIAVGDDALPERRTAAVVHSTLADLGESALFLVLGVTISLGALSNRDVWLPALALGAALVVVIRPVCGAVCLVRSRLDRRARTFAVLVGLKGAVPLLLARLLLDSAVPQAARWYAVLVVVVLLSVIVQGGLVPSLARRLGVGSR